MHINDRGPHTTVIEGAEGILKLLRKAGAEISPGFIEGRVGAKGRSVKLKKLSSETFEMVVVANSSKQTFKIYGSDQIGITKVIQGLKSNGWNIPNTLDISKC